MRSLCFVFWYNSFISYSLGLLPCSFLVVIYFFVTDIYGKKKSLSFLKMTPELKIWFYSSKNQCIVFLHEIWIIIQIPKFSGRQHSCYKEGSQRCRFVKMDHKIWLYKAEIAKDSQGANRTMCHTCLPSISVKEYCNLRRKSWWQLMKKSISKETERINWPTDHAGETAVLARIRQQ